MGGSPRVVVSPGQDLPDLDWPGELAHLTDAWPHLGPTWLAATERATPKLRPWHTVATRARGELALTAGYILTEPPAATDHEPRTYLGWALGAEPFFPALLLGSPLGHRTEVAYNFWTPSLMGAIVGALVPAAFEAGVRCVLAPWIADRRGNRALVDALVAAGGHSAFWGQEDFMRLDAGGWDEHLSALPPQTRRGIGEDVRLIERADGAQVRPHVPGIAELACRNGAGGEPSAVAAVLTSLLDGGADVRAYLGRRDGRLVASCVTIRKNHRLFVNWPGFDRAAVGERGGIYLALVRDAYGEGLRTVEFGAGAHRGEVPHGTRSRTVTTAMVLADPGLRRRAAAGLDAFGRSRVRAAGPRLTRRSST